MRIAVTGASGFVGSALVRRLVAEGHQVRALVRPGSKRPAAPEAMLQVAEGDITRPETLPAAFTGCDAVVHLVGIIRETAGQTFESVHAQGTSNVVSAAAASGVRRIVHMSALGTGQGSASRYHKSKEEGETFVRNFEGEWVIMRPSIIAGRGDGFTTMLIDLVRRAPVIPVIGGGKSLLQPIAVEDVATVFYQALTGERHVGQTYLLGGPEKLQFITMVRQIRRQLGMRKPLVVVPLPLMSLVAGVMSRITSRFPLTPDQLVMLQQDNVAEPNHAQEVFGLALAPYEDVLRRILGS